MIPELGYLSLVIAFIFCCFLSLYPILGAHRGNLSLMRSGPVFAYSALFFTFISFLCLVYAFVNNDFTVAYVANHSNSLLPLIYRITAVWGGHEGSFLLWVLILACWFAAVAFASKGLNWPFRARVLSVLGWVGLGFYLFILLVSNPFERLLPYFPIDGQDLNPVLQDPGMIIHPPMLYIGFSGFAVSFAFAIAALISGKLDASWAKWSRPWTLAAWVFLTLGIALGSWWAYYELGWGGWWFWDPVENASFMPWLLGTALLHSLAVTEKRGVFKSWTVLLAIATFSLSLLGTFLVRSGVVVSVHAFASDPTRGLFILGFLFLVIGGSLLLYAWRASSMRSTGKYKLFSREVMLWGNNILLTAAMLVVLLGTLLPLVHKELGMGSISIGVPFFNEMFTYLIVPFAVLVGIGPLVRWKQEKFKKVGRALVLTMLFSVAITWFVATIGFDTMVSITLLGILLGVWVTLSTIRELTIRMNHFGSWQQGLAKLSGSHWAMILGHLGFAVSLIGIAVTSQYSTEKDVRMAVGEQIDLGGYRFVFSDIKRVEGPNYEGHEGVINIYQEDKQVAQLLPQKRMYVVQRMPMTEAAIDASLWRDLYVALGEPMNAAHPTQGEWALRVYHKPFVRWVWLGAIFMAFGGLCALFDKRYRRKAVARNFSATTSFSGVNS
ncbi:heme lyase CcmF/NrfE family subunit [Flocculibacter collagenilyticus]|uniref:heme lyase CcmF/NrfE family subunit n=1 Tax=Flocculibacter collagenilyticus TaxID=2744479 RepID=UPI0018F63A31|nr:heme lyase CcmF/NrfE family subunit [Flocculibacter collagenilyticus]